MERGSIRLYTARAHKTVAHERGGDMANRQNVLREREYFTIPIATTTPLHQRTAGREAKASTFLLDEYVSYFAFCRSLTREDVGSNPLTLTYGLLTKAMTDVGARDVCRQQRNRVALGAQVVMRTPIAHIL